MALPGLSRSTDTSLDAVVATVNRTVITRRDLRYHVLEWRLYDTTLWGIPDELLEREVLTDVVDEVLLYEHFWQADREPDASQLKDAATEAWKRLEHLAGSPETFNTMLRRSSIAAQDMKRWLETRASRTWTIESRIAGQLDPALFDREEPPADQVPQVQIAHLFIRPIDRTREPSWVDAQQRALRIHGEIAEGLAFEQAALLYSDDAPTAKTGGELGWLSPSSLEPGLREALATLRPGGVSPPARSSSGWHLLKLLDMDTPRRTELRRASQALKRQVLTRLRSEADLLLADGYRLVPLAEQRDEERDAPEERLFDFPDLTTPEPPQPPPSPAESGGPSH